MMDVPEDLSVDGINDAGEMESPDYDTHCPLMGQKPLNYYQASCRLRNTNPLLHRTCYPVCKLK